MAQVAGEMGDCREVGGLLGEPGCGGSREERRCRDADVIPGHIALGMEPPAPPLHEWQGHSLRRGHWNWTRSTGKIVRSIVSVLSSGGFETTERK